MRRLLPHCEAVRRVLGQIRDVLCWRPAGVDDHRRCCAGSFVDDPSPAAQRHLVQQEWDGLHDFETCGNHSHDIACKSQLSILRPRRPGQKRWCLAERLIHNRAISLEILCLSCYGRGNSPSAVNEAYRPLDQQHRPGKRGINAAAQPSRHSSAELMALRHWL